MRIFLLSAVLIISISFGINHVSYAACSGGPVFTCDTTAPNPDPDGIQQSGNLDNLTVIVEEGAGIDTSLQPVLDDDGIELGNGDDMVTVTGGSVIGQDTAIEVNSGNNTVTVIDSLLRGITNNGINSGNGQDTIYIENTTITTVENTVVTSGDGEENITVIDSQILLETASGNDQAISGGSGNDTVFIERSYLRGGNTNDPFTTAIRLGSGDDQLTLGTGAVLRGLRPGNAESFGVIECENGFDTIIFAMAVPESQLAALTAEIESLNPADDSITINGLFYTWLECEELVPQLTAGFASPVPTLSQWGLIAMAGVLGIVGFMVIRRRQATA